MMVKDGYSKFLWTLVMVDYKHKNKDDGKSDYKGGSLGEV